MEEEADMPSPKILVVNGPNLNFLGKREPEVYGTATLDDLEEKVGAYVRQFGIECDFFQSNSEGALIGALQKAAGAYDGIVYNPGAHAHYSYALRDAVASLDVPVVEVHLTDIAARETFRRESVIAPECVALVKGLGIEGYCRAVDVFRENEILVPLGESYVNECAPGANIIVGKERCEEPDLHDFVDGDAMDGDAPAFEEVGLVSYERQTLVKAACMQLGVDALLVRDTSNVRWISAFDGVFDEEWAHALLVTPERSALHTDSRYSNALRSAAESIGSDIAISDERVSHARFACDALAGEGAAAQGKLGIEDAVTYDEFVRTADVFGAERIVPTHDVVRGLRGVKDAGEVARLKAAQAITDAAFSHIVEFIKPGMTEREVQLELEFYMLRHGAEGLAFRSIVATGANGADPHAVPGDTTLEAGQCVVMDFGAKALGYCSDMTRMVFLGQPDAQKADAYAVLRSVNEAVEAALRPGMTGKEAHDMAERLLAEGGYAGKMGHGLGHGVGLDVHELPVLNSRYDSALVEGNVVTVEPGIYLPGEFGMRLEDFGVVTASGFDVFTQSTHDMVVL